MVEQFAGKWKLVLSENFDEYMKELGVNSATRYIGNMMKPKFIISVGEDGVISMKTQSALKSVEIKFKLDEEFEEKTADDRLTKTIITLNDGKLVQKQTWEGKTTTLERTLQGGNLITTCTIGDSVAVRTYEREE